MAAYNSNIATVATSSLTRRILTWNIANAARDEDKKPLSERLDGIGKSAKDLKPDALWLLEANRPSQGKSWTEMALEIEKSTGMKHYGCYKLNATPMSFGKALFYNPDTMFISEIKQHWISETPDVPSGDYFGSDVTLSTFMPVVNGKVVIKPLTVGAVHCPMQRASRMKYCEHLVTLSGKVHVLMGDFNTFSDDGGQDMIELLETKYVESLPEDTQITFSAFEHDTLEIPKDKLVFHPYAEILTPQSNVINDVDGQRGEEESEKVIIRPRSWLDHIFVNKDLPSCLSVKSTAHGPDTDKSDHAILESIVTFDP